MRLQILPGRGKRAGHLAAPCVAARVPHMLAAAAHASAACRLEAIKDAMLDFLFRRLTVVPGRGADLFASVVHLARQPHWYVEGAVPDTLDGRFAVLATITAFLLVRLERDGEPGDAVSVALTERFIEAMEAEHRELGLGDPTLGKTVRKLVGALARRTELWRTTTAGGGKWAAATRASLYRSDVPATAEIHSAKALKRLWTKFRRFQLAEIQQGKLQ